MAFPFPLPTPVDPSIMTAPLAGARRLVEACAWLVVSKSRAGEMAEWSKAHPC